MTTDTTPDRFGGPGPTRLAGPRMRRQRAAGRNPRARRRGGRRDGSDETAVPSSRRSDSRTGSPNVSITAPPTNTVVTSNAATADAIARPTMIPVRSIIDDVARRIGRFISASRVVVDVYASRHPEARHGHAAPPGSTAMCASEPALPWAPRNRMPSMTTAGLDGLVEEHEEEARNLDGVTVPLFGSGCGARERVEVHRQTCQFLQLLPERNALHAGIEAGVTEPPSTSIGPVQLTPTIDGSATSSGRAARIRRTTCSSDRHTSRAGFRLGLERARRRRS